MHESPCRFRPCPCKLPAVFLAFSKLPAVVMYSQSVLKSRQWKVIMQGLSSWSGHGAIRNTRQKVAKAVKSGTASKGNKDSKSDKRNFNEVPRSKGRLELAATTVNYLELMSKLGAWRWVQHKKQILSAQPEAETSPKRSRFRPVIDARDSQIRRPTADDTPGESKRKPK